MLAVNVLPASRASQTLILVERLYLDRQKTKTQLIKVFPSYIHMHIHIYNIYTYTSIKRVLRARRGLRNYIMGLYYSTILWNCITGQYYGTILRNYITG